MKKHMIITTLGIGLALAVSGCAAGGREKISVGAEVSAQEAAGSSETTAGRIEIKESSADELEAPAVPDGKSQVPAVLGGETVPEVTAAGTSTPAGSLTKIDIRSELRQLEEQSKALENLLSSARSQSDMTEISGERYKLWDNKLNEFWSLLKEVMSEEEFSSLTEEERQWIAAKDAEVKEDAAPYEDGSMYSMMVTGKAAELTRKRVYVLADLLSAKYGQPYKDEYSGAYTAPQETEDTPCDLYLDYLGVGAYDAELGLGSGAYWKPKGIAIADGETLFFEDPNLRVNGTISRKDAGLSFTVTESELAEAAAGARFDFPEKYEYPTRFSFADISGLEFWFGSGSGAWCTVLYVHEDGSFEGEYHDSDMGSREYYLCDFSGTFTEPERINPYTWSVKIASLDFANEPDTSEVIDGVTYHYSDPFGLTDAGELLFYLPKAPFAKLPADFKSWAGACSDSIATQALLPFYGLYNVDGRQGFSSHPKTD